MTVAHHAVPVHLPSLAAALGTLRARGLRISAARRLVMRGAVRRRRARSPPTRSPAASAGAAAARTSRPSTRNLEHARDARPRPPRAPRPRPGLYALADRTERELPALRALRAPRRARRLRARRARAAIRAATGFERALHPLPDRRASAPTARRERPTDAADVSARHAHPGRLPRAGWPRPPRSLAVAAVAYALRVADRDLDEERVPLLGVLAAFVFAVQMLNFPVAGGTSGHLLGAALAAVLLGPWLACLVMAVVLTAQAFVFADGGITALGANVLNMGVLGALLAGC